MLDQLDIRLIEDFIFEARMEVNKDGAGAKVFAFAYRYDQPRETGKYLQDLLW